ncbi:8-oxo-dGTP pyrophosphatase MutT, NUDIX family [Modestobacter sp. DSM 44400]|uniref:NUDIX hydrolase n=1 Tax=Modestobacter sp. DSM 44400 TaxID=1550230 RepID=UPI0008943B51|nr:NUDIX domain-containing protein [Modestobacter sp. DSM 44400]SDX68442.1 8-oxo-dGTP pyrophosphatase MutT, NUDIX family [Modestobacter sp. DSM 44400]
MTAPVWVRPASRVLVLDPQQRVLLLGSRGPTPDPQGPIHFWYTPGGGVEDGEDLRTAAARELAEEIGLVVPPAALEGPVWLRRHVWPWGDTLIDSRETFFVLRDVVHEVDPRGRMPEELLGDEPHRWWSAEEIAAGAVDFVPRELGTVLPDLLTGPWGGPPRVVD